MNYWHQRYITWDLIYWFINRYRINYVLKFSSLSWVVLECLYWLINETKTISLQKQINTECWSDKQCANVKFRIMLISKLIDKNKNIIRLSRHICSIIYHIIYLSNLSVKHVRNTISLSSRTSFRRFVVVSKFEKFVEKFVDWFECL